MAVEFDPCDNCVAPEVCRDNATEAAVEVRPYLAEVAELEASGDTEARNEAVAAGRYSAGKVIWDTATIIGIRNCGYGREEIADQIVTIAQEA